MTAGPGLFVVGAPKSGTTSMTRWLAGHPDVYVSVPKEPFYWASDFPGLRAHYGFESRAAYDALFACDEAQRALLRAEGSTFYLYSRRAVADIVAAAGEGPAPRFVVALRNPVDLLISYHRTQLVALNETETDFGAAWSRSLAGGGPDTTPLDPKVVDYPMIGALGAAMARLLAQVPRSDVHVVWFDELRADAQATWDGLADFAGLDRTPLPDAEQHNASLKTYRFGALRRLMHRPPGPLAAPVRRLRQWSRTSDSGAVARLKRTMWRPVEHPSAGPETRARVAEHFRDDIGLLGRLVGRDLSGWLDEPEPAGAPENGSHPAAPVP